MKPPKKQKPSPGVRVPVAKPTIRHKSDKDYSREKGKFVPDFIQPTIDNEDDSSKVEP